MKLKYTPRLVKRSNAVCLSLMASTTIGLHAQNNSTGSGNWDASFSNLPERQDGVLTNSVAGTLGNVNPDGSTSVGQGLENNAGGQGVNVDQGNAVTIDGTTNTGLGGAAQISASANANSQSGAFGSGVAVGGAGYAETATHLYIGAGDGSASGGAGTLDMTGGRLDVGMANGGVFLQGDADANAGTIDTNVGALSLDGNYRNVEALNSVNSRTDSDSNDPFRQYYLPTDNYDPSNAAASTAGATTANPLPLFQAGGSLHIGNTDVNGGGTFNISGGELNVVQYGWNWASNGGASVDWEANGTRNNAANDGTAISMATYNANNNGFEGYEIDYATGGYTNTGTADRTQPASGNQVFVDAESLINEYIQPGTTLTTNAGAGEGDYQFGDPNFATNSWDNTNDGSRGPYADYVNEGVPIPAGGTDGELVDHYHEIARTGGNINVGSSGGALGTMNISGDAQITTNNLVIGNKAIDDAGTPANNTTGIVNMSGGDVYTRESIIVGSGTWDDDDFGTQGTLNHTGGALEAVNDLVVGAGGDGVVNFNSNTGNDGTDNQHIIIGDDILVGQGRFGDGTINFNGTENILSSEREGNGGNNIILGAQSYGANSSNIAQFNYNAGAGEIGSQALSNEWDSIKVGSGWTSAGGFDHNNENTIYLDQNLEVGENLNTMGHVVLEGANGSGGISVDDQVDIGQYGRAIMEQGGDTTLTIGSDGTGALNIGEYGTIDSPTAWVRDATDTINQNNPYTDPDMSGRADPAIPVFDDATARGRVLSASDLAHGTSAGYFYVEDNATVDIDQAYIGKGGVGRMYYDSTQNLNVDEFVIVGNGTESIGELTITSNNINVNFDTDANNTTNTANQGNNDFITGRSGTGVTNIGTATHDATTNCLTSDGNGLGVTLDVGADNNIIIGSAATLTTDTGQVTIVTDAGDGTLNLNGAGASIALGTGNNIIIGSGDNVSEGIKFDETGNDRRAALNNTTGAVDNIQNPFTDQGDFDTALTGNAADNTILTGTQFGTASTLLGEDLSAGSGAVMAESGGTATTDNSVNYVPSADDGKGSIGAFNHNNDWNPIFSAANQVDMASGDNSIATYAQNGASTVTLGDSSALVMSRDGNDVGNATNSAATAISSPMSFEMGQSTYTVNNAGATLNVNGSSISGGSIDTAGSGAVVADTYGAGLVQGGLHNRDNEAQINLQQGRIENIGGATIQADIVQTGGIIEISQDGGTGAETATLSQMHDFIQVDGVMILGADGCSIAADGGAVEFTMVQGNSAFNAVPGVIQSGINPALWDANSTSAANTGGINGAANSGSEMDTIVADHIDLTHATASIIVNFDESFDPVNGKDVFAEGMIWDLLDFTTFDATEYTDNASMDSFAYRDSSGTLTTGLPSLAGLTGDNGGQLHWSVGPLAAGTLAPDIWTTHGAIYIYEEGVNLPEPSTTLLAGLGGLTLLGRRKRKV